MSPSTRLTARLLLAAVAALLALLVAEGATSLLTGSSLRARLAHGPGGNTGRIDTGRIDTGRIAPATANRPADTTTGATTPLSEYRVHGDPLVGYVLRDTSVAPLPQELFHTDALGMRVRPGPAPLPGAQRIVVLGDSVAFGMGLHDDETLAAQLEAQLAAARGPDAPPLACFTVAGPGWNHQNEVHFLFDHFAAFDPDVVVYMPTSNDLADTYMIDELGRSRVGYDPTEPDPLLAVNWESLHFFEHDLGERVASGAAQGCRPDEMGPFAIMTDLGTESRRRYDRNADSIALLAQTLSRLGRKLVLLHSSEDATSSGYVWFLRERLLDRGLRVPEVPGLLSLLPEFTLGENPHPNADATRAMALWVAADLLQRGWVSRGAGTPLPDAGSAFLKHRAAPRDEATVRARAAGFRERDLAALQSKIDFRTGRGFAQVYGGLNPDGTLGTKLLAMLKPAGSRLRVTLAPLSADPVLYPLDVRVSVNGAIVGTITLPPGADTAAATASAATAASATTATTATFDLPPRSDASAPIEVLLAPAQWTVDEYRHRTIVAAARLVSIECVGP